MVKFLIKLGFFLIISIIAFAILSNVFIIAKTKAWIYADIDTIPKKDIALVLGTSKKNIKGEANSFFDNRIEAAAKLFHKGKVKGFLLSGDNRTKYYDEPNDMRQALKLRGVPDSVISVDTAGLSTLESVYRCKDVFKHENFTIITQEFHAYRALYISRFYETEAIAFPAKEVPIYSSTRVIVREFFARPKALLDLYLPKKLSQITNSEP